MPNPCIKWRGVYLSAFCGSHLAETHPHWPQSSCVSLHLRMQSTCRCVEKEAWWGYWSQSQHTKLAIKRNYDPGNEPSEDILAIGDDGIRHEKWNKKYHKEKEMRKQTEYRPHSWARMSHVVWLKVIPTECPHEEITFADCSEASPGRFKLNITSQYPSFCWMLISCLL
jgi:hypothetical protein